MRNFLCLTIIGILLAAQLNAQSHGAPSATENYIFADSLIPDDWRLSVNNFYSVSKKFWGVDKIKRVPASFRKYERFGVNTVLDKNIGNNIFLGVGMLSAKTNKNLHTRESYDKSVMYDIELRGGYLISGTDRIKTLLALSLEIPLDQRGQKDAVSLEPHIFINNDGHLALKASITKIMEFTEKIELRSYTSYKFVFPQDRVYRVAHNINGNITQTNCKFDPRDYFNIALFVNYKFSKFNTFAGFEYFYETEDKIDDITAVNFPAQLGSTTWPLAYTNNLILGASQNINDKMQLTCLFKTCLKGRYSYDEDILNLILNYNF